jgi:hypothetical protein
MAVAAGAAAGFVADASSSFTVRKLAMAAIFTAGPTLAQEASALLTRLERLKPFALHVPMVVAAAISPSAQTAIEQHMLTARRELRERVLEYLGWLRSPVGRRAPPEELQRRFTFLRLRFNLVLSEFDIFSDALTQRAEHEHGVWMAGLDALAAEALRLPGDYYETPPVICYLDRGIGAAIRRVRTRLPGGGKNPVAIIRVPRERMVGSGIASSLVHEVGHQAAALLDLLGSLRPVLQEHIALHSAAQPAWQLFQRWLSEIVADFWSVAKIGIAATFGLMAVVSLPAPFMFRVSPEDPHPMPWFRVKISCAMGEALYPHPQWQALAKLWEALYPTNDLDEPQRQLILVLERNLPEFADLLVEHRPASLRGASLREAIVEEQRTPQRLLGLYQAWAGHPQRLCATPPSLAFAAIGQARAENQITPRQESDLLAQLLTHWALRNALNTSAECGLNMNISLCRRRGRLFQLWPCA